MSVYVDALKLWPGSGTIRWCHVIADTEEELHAMASRCGLKRQWFQTKSFPHYDAQWRIRQRLVEAGAIECSRTEFVGHVRRLRGMELFGQ